MQNFSSISFMASLILKKYFFRKFRLSVTIKFSDMDKIHVVGRGLPKKHFCKTVFKIPAVTQK